MPFIRKFFALFGIKALSYFKDPDIPALQILVLCHDHAEPRYEGIAHESHFIRDRIQEFEHLIAEKRFPLRRDERIGDSLGKSHGREPGSELVQFHLFG